MAISRPSPQEPAGEERRQPVAEAGQAQVGRVYDGVIKRIVSYGAFVRLEGLALARGLDGLLHVGEITQMHVAKVENVLSIGERIKVLVTATDHASGRISLSTKHLERYRGEVLRARDDVWQDAEAQAARLREQAEAKGLAFADLLHERGAELAAEARARLLADTELFVAIAASEAGAAPASEGATASASEAGAAPASVGAAAVHAQLPRGFQVGHAYEGTVLSITDGLILLDLGNGLEGKLERFQLTSGWQQAALDKLSQGMRLKAMAASPTPDSSGRIVVSTRLLEPTPGDMARNPQLVFDKAEETATALRLRAVQRQRVASEEKRRELLGAIEAGQEYDGRVQSLNVATATAIVELPNGALGRLSWLMLGKGAAVGDSVKVRVGKKDKSGYAKLALPPVVDLLETLELYEVYAGTVRLVRPYGVFVDLDVGGTGLLHISQISKDRVPSEKLPELFPMDTRVKVLLLTCAPERNRATLSTKKLEVSPGDMLRDPQLVYERAEEMAQQFRETQEAKRSQE